MANDEVIGPRKTMFVLVIVVGCFAVLWPRILSPLVLGPSREQMQPNQFDREAGCCEVIFETDVAILELVNEVCSSSLGVGLLSPQSAAECRKAVNDTCGVDIAVFLKRNENVGKTTKMLVETMQNSNSSCLREHFGVPVYSLGPHLASKAWDIKDTLKQERAPPIRGIGPHPALRERGRAIPPGPPGPPPPPASKPIALPPHVRVRSPLSVYYENEQPPPIPGMRPPLGSPGGPVPAPKSSMGFVMPIYTICIIVFFVYTLSKILFRRTASPYDPVAPDPQFRRRVFRDDSRSSPDKLGKKEADAIVTAISGLVAEVQQQMEASTAQNQQRQDVQDNARPYTNGTILLNSGPVQIVASEYKDAPKEKTSEPVNEKESTPEPKETEPTKVAKEPEHDVVAPECNERTVVPKEPSPEVSKPSPEPVEQNEATPETVVEESPLESLQTKEIRRPSPEPKESSTAPSVHKNPSPELISQLAEASLESETIEPSVTESESSSDHKETTSTLEQSISEPEVVKEPTPEPTSQDIQISLDPTESIDTLPTKHSTQPKDITPELYLAQPSPEPKEPLLDTEEFEELVLVPNESTQEPTDSVLELIESVSEPIQSIPESIVSQSQYLILEPNEILPESEEKKAQPQEHSPDSKESVTLVEESLESKEPDPKVNASIESGELTVPSLLTDAIEPSLDLKVPADPKLEVSTPEYSGSLSEIETTIPEQKSPTTDTLDSIPHNEFTPDTEHIQEVDAPEVDRSTVPLDDTSTLKEPTPQSKPSSEPEGTVEISPPQVKNAALIDLEEAIAELDDATDDIKIPEKSTLEETKDILDETNKPQVSKETLQHLDESIAELDDATAKLQEKTIDKGSPDRSEAEDDVNAEVLKVFEASDALEESPKQTTDKFLKNERFTVTKRTTPEHIEDMKGKPIELLTPTETPAAFKVLGMETTAHRVDNSAWPRDLPAPSPAPPHRPPHEAEEVKSIFLETEIPQQSRVLVAQFEEDRQESRDKPQPARHSPLVVSGKMTLSLIQDAPRDTPDRDPESTYDEFTTASAVTQPAAEKGEIESEEEIDEEIEVEEIEEEIEEEEEEEEPPSPNPAAKK